MKWIALHLIAILVAAGCSGDLGTDYRLDEKSFTAEWMTKVEARTGILLPKGSRGLRMFYKGNAIDPSFVAKVEIPGSTEPAVASSIAKILNEDGSVSGSLSEQVDWWKPSAATIRTQRQFPVLAAQLLGLDIQPVDASSGIWSIPEGYERVAGD